MDAFIANVLAGALGQVAGEIVTKKLMKIATYNQKSFPFCQTILTKEKSGYLWDKQVTIHTDKDGVHVRYVEPDKNNSITYEEFEKILKIITKPKKNKK